MAPPMASPVAPPVPVPDAIMTMIAQTIAGQQRVNELLATIAAKHTEAEE